jgi:hypothetical protein
MDDSGESYFNALFGSLYPDWDMDSFTVSTYLNGLALDVIPSILPFLDVSRHIK